MELAVNMPEHDPHVGHAERSYLATSASEVFGLAACTMASIRSAFFVEPSSRMTLPASIGPPETKIAGMFSRMAAISMPGVILSQLEMHTIASAQWALHIYSTASAMCSREGSE